MGSGSDVTIASLAKIIKDAIGYGGAISFDPTKPDGPLKKMIDSSCLISIGWHQKISLVEGIKLSYQDFRARL